MDINNLLKFLKLIETIGLEYMICGSVASIMYGKPRLTQDMDIVVVFPKSKVKQFADLFDISEYYCPPQESIMEALDHGQKGHMNIIDQKTGFKIDIYPAGDDPLNIWGFKNRRKEELLQNETVWVAPPEYVIVKKLEYYKEGGSQKHLYDIKGMLEVSDSLIARNAILEWCDRLNLKREWDLALSAE